MYIEERRRTKQEGLEGIKKMDKNPVSNLKFLQGEEGDLSGLGSFVVPQPPEYPQPAREYGLPRWQREPQAMIEDVMLKWTGRIKSEQDYIAVQDRLKYLESYQPRLKGELRIRCDTAIRLLKDRMTEYEGANISKFLSKMAIFVKKKIETDTGLLDAENYLTELEKWRLQLTGSYARAAMVYISRLKELISDYRGKPQKQIASGSPGEKAEPTPIENIPPVLRLFWTYVLGEEFVPIWKHTIDSAYCKIETITPEKEWRLRFEDRDETAYPVPDWDYDEPILHVVRTNNELNVTLEKYGGGGYSDIYYGATRLWWRAGGLLHWQVGKTVSITVPAEEEKPPVVTPIPPSPIIATLKTVVPWIIGIVALGGTIAVAVKKKK